VKRILIYDDDPDTAGLFKRVLEYAGHQVSTVKDEAELFHVLEDRRFNLVMVNSQFGCAYSAGLAARCKQIHGQIKTMTIVNSVCDDTVTRFFDDYLVKPVEIEAIEAKVNELLGVRP
jgi:DNA-binding response OmpR family regulator